MSISRVRWVACGSNIRIALLAGLVGGIGFAPAAAEAQCVECGAQIMNSTIQGIGTYHRETSRVDEETRRELNRLHGNGRAVAPRSSAGYASEPIEDQLMAEVMGSLQSEANRRVATDGKQNAESWYVNAGQAVGSELGRLMPEYQRRVRSDGRANADAWYLAVARERARGYIESTR